MSDLVFGPNRSPVGRISYPFIWTPRESQDGKGKPSFLGHVGAAIQPALKSIGRLKIATLKPRCKAIQRLAMWS
jgi:hypothetical protein